MLCGTQQCSRLGLRAGWTPGKVGQCWVIGRHWTTLDDVDPELFGNVLDVRIWVRIRRSSLLWQQVSFSWISVGRVVHPVRADCEL